MLSDVSRVGNGLNSPLDTALAECCELAVSVQELDVDSFRQASPIPLNRLGLLVECSINFALADWTLDTTKSSSFLIKHSSVEPYTIRVTMTKPLATLGILSIGDMGVGIARLLTAHNYRVVTNASDRR